MTTRLMAGEMFRIVDFDELLGLRLDVAGRVKVGGNDGADHQAAGSGQGCAFRGQVHAGILHWVGVVGILAIPATGSITSTSKDWHDRKLSGPGRGVRNCSSRSNCGARF
jgi:hypothetical protein